MTTLNIAKNLALVGALCWSLASGADVAIPALAARVTDQTATLTVEQKAALEQTLQAFEARKGSQIAVLIVPTTEPEPIEQYSLRAVEQWKLGRKKVDDGALLVVAKNDRTVRIEVGYGLEGALNDAISNRIITEVIAPKFKDGDFYGGINAGIDRMIKVVDGEPLPAPQQSSSVFKSKDIQQFVPAIFLLALVIGGVLRSLLGRLPGAIAAAGVIGLLAWFVAGALLATVLAGGIAFLFTLMGGGMGGRGGFYGGGHHGGMGAGGFGGGAGGFGGGGGGFGGGGASGRW